MTNQYPPGPNNQPQQPYPQQPQQAYPQAGQPYPQAPGQPYPYGQPAAAPVSPPTNSLAIIALILGIVIAPAGIVTGHMALSKIKRTGEGGRGLALAGTILGYIGTAAGLLAIIFSLLITFVFGAVAVTAAGAGLSQAQEYEQSLEEFGTDQVEPEADPAQLLDTPEKILAEWPACDLARELNNSTGEFMDDAEWYAAQEALAQLLGPGADADAIRAYIEHMKLGTAMDLNLTAGHVAATEAAEAKFCTQ